MPILVETEIEFFRHFSLVLQVLQSEIEVRIIDLEHCPGLVRVLFRKCVVVMVDLLIDEIEQDEASLVLASRYQLTGVDLLHN